MIPLVYDWQLRWNRLETDTHHRQEIRMVLSLCIVSIGLLLLFLPPDWLRVAPRFLSLLFYFVCPLQSAGFCAFHCFHFVFPRDTMERIIWNRGKSLIILVVISGLPRCHCSSLWVCPPHICPASVHSLFCWCFTLPDVLLTVKQIILILMLMN